MSIDSSKNFLERLLDKIFKDKRVIVGDKAKEITNKINKLRVLAKDAKLDKNIELEHEELLEKNERIYSNFSKAIYSHLKNLYQKVLEETKSEEDTKKIFGCTQEKWNERFIDEADDDFIELLALWEETIAKMVKNLDKTEKSSSVAKLTKWYDENKDIKDSYTKFNNSMVEMERMLRREIPVKVFSPDYTEKKQGGPEAITLNTRKVQIRCKLCGTRLRFPKTKKTLIVTCPNCKNSFEYKSDNTRQFDILTILINLFYGFATLIEKIMPFTSFMDSEKRKDEERQKIRKQLISSKSRQIP